MSWVRTCAVGLALILVAYSAVDGAETRDQREARLAWWREGRLGMFIHWGPVSLKGTEISWSRANTNRECPNNGPIPADVYDNLYKEFNPTKFDAEQWVRLAESAGMKYMVLTAKHCDGFAMWHSKATDYNISKTPFKRDICGELAKAAQQRGMRIGWYYSPMDWRDPDCRSAQNARYVASMQAQLREILGDYGRIDLLWFDTDGKSAPWDQDRTYALMRSLQPRIIINNRLDMGSERDYEEQKIGPSADYFTPEQRVGGFDDQRPWETCMTLGTQWSWKPDDRIKSAKEAIQILIACAGGDGNLLLNVGPMPSGEIEPRQAEVLRAMGQWLDKYGQSIYATRGGPFKPANGVFSTRKGNTVYVHVTKWNGDAITLPALRQKIVASSLLTGGVVRVTQTDKQITCSVAKEDQQEIDTIIKLELDGPAGQPQAVAPDRAIQLFNGKDLSGWTTWLKTTGREDPMKVYSVQDGMIRISGDGLGYLATEKAYKDYHFIVEYKWGQKHDASGNVRNSGVLVHAIGPDGGFNNTFMTCIECQLAQGCEGDLIVIRGKDENGKVMPATITSETEVASDGKTRWKAGGKKTVYSGRQFWWSKHEPGFEEKLDNRGKEDVASPVGQWTRVELLCKGDRVTVKINGVTVNECFDVWPAGGKILLENEDNEIYFRRVELRPVEAE